MSNLNLSYTVIGAYETSPFRLKFITPLEPKRGENGPSNFVAFHNLSTQIKGKDVNVLLMIYNNNETTEVTSNCFDHHVIVEETQICPFQSRSFFNDSKELLVIVFHDDSFNASEINSIDSELEKHYDLALNKFEKEPPFLPKRLGLSLIRR